MSIAALIFAVCVFSGFLVVGRWVDNVVAQLFFGALMGVAIMIGVICVLTGVVFAGCLLTSSGHMDFR